MFVSYAVLRFSLLLPKFEMQQMAAVVHSEVCLWTSYFTSIESFY